VDPEPISRPRLDKRRRHEFDGMLIRAIVLQELKSCRVSNPAWTRDRATERRIHINQPSDEKRVQLVSLEGLIA